jgi:hypothetical protein
MLKSSSSVFVQGVPDLIFGKNPQASGIMKEFEAIASIKQI